MQNVISIKQNSTLEDVDLYYAELYRYIKQEATVHISLPKELKKHYLGLVPALIQLVCTWVRYKKSGKLILSISANATQQEIDDLYENELIYPLVALVWNKNEVYDKNGSTNLRSFLRDKNREVASRMKSVKPFKGYKLPLVISDHIAGADLPIFEASNDFKNEEDIRESLRPAINEILNFILSLKTEHKVVLNDLKKITFELMKNTFEWGRTDGYNVSLDPNLRGVLFKFYKNRRKTLVEDFNNHPGVVHYLNNKVLKENTQAELYFLELSVFDSGIGFIKKFKSLNPSTKLSDVDIVKTCMIKHNTLAQGLEKEDKGIGLDRVLKTLNKKGFLRIKTGTVCLYRDLIANNYLELEKGDVDKMELFDWKKESNTKYTSFPSASGSVITILYPLSTQEE